MNRRFFLQQVAAAAAVTAFGAARAAAPRRPNILFCIADDASFPHMSAYGCTWIKTPAFDRVAAQGILFQHAYTPSAKCAPSRSCILTGRNTWQNGEAANHWCYFPAQLGTWMEALEAAGYHTGFTGKGWGPGVAKTADGQPRSLTCKAWSQRTATPPTKQINRCDYAGNFEDFLAARPAGTPFCFWYGGTEPHRAYEYGSGVKLGGRKPEDVDKVPAYWPDNETVRTDMLDYAFEIEHFDSHLGRILATLEKAGELDNTIVVVTSDNGMPFPRSKGQSYEISNHMPLAIMWKNGIKGAGRKVEDYVSFIDFAPTFLEAAGVRQEQTKMQPITGRSLSDIFRAEGSGKVIAARDHVLLAKERYDVGRPNDQGYPLRGIIKNGWLYIANLAPERWPAANPETGYLDADGGPTKTLVVQARQQPENKKYWDLAFGMRGPEELYNINKDPDCMENLVGREECREMKKGLKDQLFEALRVQQDPRVVGGGEKFDEYPFADNSCIHFYERYMSGEPVRAGWVSDTDYDPIDPSLTPKTKVAPVAKNAKNPKKKGKKKQ